MKEESEDINKGVIRIRMWKYDRQHNGQKKGGSRTDNTMAKNKVEVGQTTQWPKKRVEVGQTTQWPKKRWK